MSGRVHVAETVLREADTEHGAAVALFSADEQYRYLLTRTWDPTGLRFCVVMLNPSTATHEVLDPTVTRCVSFAKAHDCGSLAVVNLFALRATDPRVMKQHADPVGPHNDQAILDAVTGADLVVAAWGTHGTHLQRDAAVIDLLRGTPAPLLRLGPPTKDGHPRHPLYLAGRTALERHGDAL